MIRDEIIELKKLGRMPDESNDDIPDDVIDKYDELLESIEKPINKEEANELIKLFPDISLYGVESALLHVFESVLTSKQILTDDYIILINRCPSHEWKQNLNDRLNNWLLKNNS